MKIAERERECERIVGTNSEDMRERERECERIDNMHL